MRVGYSDERTAGTAGGQRVSQLLNNYQSSKARKLRQGPARRDIQPYLRSRLCEDEAKLFLCCKMLCTDGEESLRASQAMRVRVCRKREKCLHHRLDSAVLLGSTRLQVATTAKKSFQLLHAQESDTSSSRATPSWAISVSVQRASALTN